MLKLLAVTFLLAESLVAQTKQPTKSFTPPEDYYTAEPVVAKDEGCAKDYAKALALSGLEQRKMLAELITYKCAEVLPFHYRVLVVESKTFDVGTQHFPMVRVRLSDGGLPVGPTVVKEGWIIRSALMTKGQAVAHPVASSVYNTPARIDPPVVTIVAYQFIKNGMSYKQVRNIIGADGMEVSRSDFGEHDTVMYSWRNQDGSNMNAMFQDDELVSKAQFRLPAPQNE